MDHKNSTEKACCPMSFSSLNWWATLVVAVLAIPSVAIVIALAVPFKGIGQVAVFIVACWLCTYLGMRLMKKSGISGKSDTGSK